MHSYLHLTSVEWGPSWAWHVVADLLTSSSRISALFACSRHQNYSQMAGKLIPRHKNAVLRLKKHGSWRNFSCLAEKRSLHARYSEEPLLNGSLSFSKVHKWNKFLMNFMDEVLLHFQLYSTVFIANTLHAILNTLPKISNFLNSIQNLLNWFERMSAICSTLAVFARFKQMCWICYGAI